MKTVEVDVPDFDDACDDGWYGCGVDGCCVDCQWWAQILPPHPFWLDGLVHLTACYDPRQSYCGEPAAPYGVQLFSTDAAQAYAADQAAFAAEVTCLMCISYEAVIVADRLRWR